MVMPDCKTSFVAIDVETANDDMASICQIGMAKYNNGVLVEEWSSLVDPEGYFDFINIDIHGITEEHVAGKPTFREVVNQLSSFLMAQFASAILILIVYPLAEL